MAHLKARTLCGKIRLLCRLVRDYFIFYTHLQGWQSWTAWEGGTPVLAGFRRRAKWRKMFCADPFLFHDRGINWLFYETLNSQGKGVIGCLKEVDGKWVQVGKVLEEPWHLSYPQVFEEGGRVYMIPESCDFGKGNVSLYTTDNFPFGWKKVATLIDRPFADATILKHEGHWYMACYTIPPDESAELWHAESLMGPWRRHPQWNRINQSNRLRRCGGAFVCKRGHLFRVAQDCNGVYGKRLYRVRINKISPAEYEEGPVTLLAGREDEPRGFKHTYNEIMVKGRRLAVYDVHRTYWNNPLSVFKLLWRRFLKARGRV